MTGVDSGSHRGGCGRARRIFRPTIIVVQWASLTTCDYTVSVVMSVFNTECCEMESQHDVVFFAGSVVGRIYASRHSEDRRHEFMMGSSIADQMWLS